MILSFYNFNNMGRNISFRSAPLCDRFHSYMISYAYLVHSDIHVYMYLSLQTEIFVIRGRETSFKQICWFKIMTKLQHLREMHVHDKNIILIKL